MNSIRIRWYFIWHSGTVHTELTALFPLGDVFLLFLVLRKRVHRRSIFISFYFLHSHTAIQFHRNAGCHSWSWEFIIVSEYSFSHFLSYSMYFQRVVVGDESNVKMFVPYMELYFSSITIAKPMIANGCVYNRMQTNSWQTHFCFSTIQRYTTNDILEYSMHPIQRPSYVLVRCACSGVSASDFMYDMVTIQTMFFFFFYSVG